MMRYVPGCKWVTGTTFSVFLLLVQAETVATCALNQDSSAAYSKPFSTCGVCFPVIVYCSSLCELDDTTEGMIALIRRQPSRMNVKAASVLETTKVIGK